MTITKATNKKPTAKRTTTQSTTKLSTIATLPSTTTKSSTTDNQTPESTTRVPRTNASSIAQPTTEKTRTTNDCLTSTSTSKEYFCEQGFQNYYFKHNIAINSNSSLRILGAVVLGNGSFYVLKNSLSKELFLSFHHTDTSIKFTNKLNLFIMNQTEYISHGTAEIDLDGFIYILIEIRSQISSLSRFVLCKADSFGFLIKAKSIAKDRYNYHLLSFNKNDSLHFSQSHS